jgi:molybdopterin-guanine dinucleotide biosynthesis protein A
VKSSCGVLLAGGSSSRFGEDKFLFVFENLPMGVRCAKALGGACDVAWIQGGIPQYGTLTSLDVRMGHREGSGPLGAIIDAMESCAGSVLLTLPCDVPRVSSEDLMRMVSCLDEDHDVAIATSIQECGSVTHHWLIGAWRISSLPILREQFASGIRAVHRAAERISVLDVPFEPGVVLNMNERPL